MLPYKNMLISFSTVLLLFCMCTNLYAQKKLEYEYRIKEQNVPQRALDFVNECFPASKVKWYGEESLTQKTIEAKTKVSSNLYSLEFDSLGTLLDIELLIDFESIEMKIKNAIRQHLDNQFSRYKIKRCQVQWLGDNTSLQELAMRGETILPYRTNYEIVLKGKSDSNMGFYEILFDSEGNVLKSSMIIQRNTNNLFY